ncbi:MAG: hypothetical protein WBG86_02445 [Polyangiales bacterium]
MTRTTAALCFALLAVWVGCGSDAANNVTAKCADGNPCCLTNTDCDAGEYCDGEGPCVSEGECVPVVPLPCPLIVDSETGVPAGYVCGCDGVTYQGKCVARGVGVRVAHAGACTE